MEDVKSPEEQPEVSSESPATDPKTPVSAFRNWIGKNGIIAVVAGLILVIVTAVISYKIFFSNDARSLLYQNRSSEVPTDYKINYEFAKYQISNTKFQPSLPDYSIGLSEISNLPAFETATKVPFNDSQKTALTTTNFFISINTDKFWGDNLEDATSRNDDWTQLYAKIGGGGIWERKPENSVFISSDFLLHVYHKLLEMQFEYIENTKFYPLLKKVTDTAFEKAIGEYKLADSENKQSFERVIAYFAVPKAILDAAQAEYKTEKSVDTKVDTKDSMTNALTALKGQMPTTSYEQSQTELNRIIESKDNSPSKIFGQYLGNTNVSVNHDYSQYTPRSHYNKNSVLRSYFRAMMWYGRNNFALESPELTRDALNISLIMKNSGQLKNWEYIYIPTAFLVGKSDDLGIFEYSEALKGQKKVTKQVVAKVQKDMSQYSGPKIQSSIMIGPGVMDLTKDELLSKTKGFYFMGQRFTPDALIYTTLTQGDEKPDPTTNQYLPSMTTALMAMDILGSKTSKTHVNEWVQTNAQNADKVLANRLALLRDEFKKIPDTVWTQNIYWGWLHTIRSLFIEDLNKKGYPNFVKSEDWNNKNLQTALGSYTELKHDTLLYAKQSYAEMGGGGPLENPPPVPKGYVEPNIQFMDRLIALTEMTSEGLSNRDLIDGTFKSRNEDFLAAVKFFKGIAVKELQNEKITDEEFETLRGKGGSLTHILSALPGEEMLEKNARSALIADIHTDAKNQEILYEADGIPNYIWVAVKDQNGTRLTKGLVYSYYEFTNPLGKRLNDEDWRKLNYTTDKSGLPQSPLWVQSLIK